MAINSASNSSIQKAPFKVLYSQNIPLPIDLLLYRESIINPHAQKFTSKLKQLVTKAKYATYDA